MSKNIKSFIYSFILLLCSIIISAAIAEIALRLVLPSPTSWKHPQEQYEYDPEIGHWLKPDQKAFTHDKLVEINSLGIRDREYTSNPASGTYRILAVGDSQTFGNGLASTDTWPKQLEHVLNKNNNTQFEVINSGLPGSDTWQHEIILQRMLKNYNPTTIVLAFYVNDVVKKGTPSFPKKHQGKDIENQIAYLLKKSVLLLTLRNTYTSVKQTLNPGKHFLQAQALLKNETNREIDERWEQVKKSFLAIKTLCDNNNVNLLIASLPRRDQVDGRLSAEGYNNRLESIAGQYHIPIINLHAPLQKSYLEHGKALFIPWDGHNSAITNNIIAHEIARKLNLHPAH